MPHKKLRAAFRKDSAERMHDNWSGTRDIDETVNPGEEREIRFTGTDLVFLVHPGNRADFGFRLGDGPILHFPDAPDEIFFEDHPYTKITLCNLSATVKRYYAIAACNPAALIGGTAE